MEALVVSSKPWTDDCWWRGSKNFYHSVWEPPIMYVVWKILGTLGCYVDNEIIPLKIIYLYFKIELWHLCKSLLPSAKGLSFTFMQESVVFLLIPTYLLVGKHHVVEKDLSIYGHSNIFDIIIVDNYLYDK